MTQHNALQSVQDLNWKWNSPMYLTKYARFNNENSAGGARIRSDRWTAA